MPRTRKRSAAEEPAESAARATKAAKVGAKRGAKKAAATGATLSSAEFKAKALPLHLNLTHTPPTLSKESEGPNGNQLPSVEAGAEPEQAALTETTTTADAGFIGNLTLVPSVFSTGSYGWKTSKRLTVELQDGDTDAEGKKEKVQIMLTVNATVVGSKNAKSSKEQEEEQVNVHEEAEHADGDAKEE